MGYYKEVVSLVKNPLLKVVIIEYNFFFEKMDIHYMLMKRAHEAISE